MACIKPPHNVTEPTMPGGPTATLGREAVAAFQSFVAQFDSSHILGIDVRGDRFSGGHHIQGMPSNVVMTEVVIDARTGNSRVQMSVKDEQGRELSKKAPHTMFNPALTKIQVLDEISSAMSNQQSSEVQANGNKLVRGVSRSGAVIEIVVRPDGVVATAYPSLPHLTIGTSGS